MCAAALKVIGGITEMHILILLWLGCPFIAAPPHPQSGVASGCSGLAVSPRSTKMIKPGLTMNE